LDLKLEISQLKTLVSQLMATIELLRCENEQLRSENEQIKAENNKLVLRVTELEHRLNQNSQNSHKPPSSDGYRKAAVLLPKSKKKQGGQINHKGNTLKKVENPDFIVDLRPVSCGHCAKKLDTRCETVLYDTRQVFDIPPIQLQTTEYRRIACTCTSCGGSTILAYPHGVNSEVQYGPRFRAFITLLNQECNVPVQKIRAISSAVFSSQINASTICQIQQTAYHSLEKTENKISVLLEHNEKVHADESGIRVGGKLQWLHTLGNEKFTLQFVHLKRGYEAHFGSASFLERFKNWLIHDFWSAYLRFDKCRHAFCMSHILRELQSLIDQGTKWAERFRKFFLRLYLQTDEGKSFLPENEWLKVKETFKIMLRIADKEEPIAQPNGKGGRTKQTKGRNLLQRLNEYIDGVLAFAKYEIVPFTNNLAERDIRPCKSKIKIAGSFRSIDGANAYARIRGFISTVKKHQSNTFNELVRLFEGKSPEFLDKYS
jgi:transposase